MGLNSPLPVRLEEETRKAAKILRSFVDVNNNGLDKVIPRQVLERAAGFAIFTVFKAGFVLTARAGSGVVIARLDDGSWSPPSAIGLGGFGFGGQMGAEVTDFLIVLNSRSAVSSFMSAGNLTLGGNLSVAVGPLGRNAEGSGSVNSKGHLAAMYSYSKTKGLFGGVSVEGSVIVERQDANRLAYGGNPNAKQILSGTFDPPEWAHVLIDQLEKSTGMPGGQTWINEPREREYGSPERKGRGSGSGGGYAFGEGLGAGGNTPPTNGRRSRGNSLFGGQNDRNGNGSPSRPNNTRKSSSFNPFTSGSGSPKTRNPLEHSSETYSSSGMGGTPTGGRSRSGSLLKNGEVPQPFSYMNPSRSQQQTQQKEKDKDLLGDWDAPPNANDPFSTGSSNRSVPRKPSGGEKDLLGTWESNGQNLSAQFSSLRTSDDYGGTGSKTKAFDDILEYPTASMKDEIDYTPRETESKFANIDWSTYLSNNPSGSGSGNGNGQPSNFVSIASGGKRNTSTSPTKKPRPFSSYVGGSSNKTSPNLGNSSKEFSPFEDLPVGRLRSNSNEGSRPFESYLKYSTPTSPSYDNTNTNANHTSPKPDLKLKSGLENNTTYEGYARAIGLYDFITTTEGDLNFKNGQVVIVLDKVGSDGQWWKGYSPVSGRTGIFPANYVEVVELPKVPKGGVGWGELRRRVGGSEFDL
ncbi:hypothetical protein I302_101394 [Kwoniella bestiolae CBS 10118]|uniref:SH3 domain-containing protein n=1 Tax=Kwoniella bestiolae CBS 10118 TaxID=1296100 RepID=A0A1B9GC53_9TREE|nr:hypothetical protein I302_00077 [Kwoniella bestiolae CBS 10118]OCF28589.1 hypothetical protein I302_00077 [Kwoniella bestiolae CBS 10118]